MSSPQPDADALRNLSQRFERAGWFQSDTLTTVLDTGYSFAFSPPGVERLKMLHTILVAELGHEGELTYAEYQALYRLLDSAQKKYFPKQ